MLLFTEFSINHKELLSVLSLGTEKALRSFSNFISPVIVNRIILLFGGTIAMSAFSIQKDLVNFTEIFASGLANAAALQAGVYDGEMNSEAMLASDVLRILLLMLTVWLYYVVLTKKVFPSSNDYLALPDTFYFRPGDIISLDIRDTEDVSLVS